MEFTKKHWLLFVGVFALAVAVGHALFTYGNEHWSNGARQGRQEPTRINHPTISANEQEARNTLVDFFDNLYGSDYDTALGVYGGDWEQLGTYSANKKHTTTTLEAFCNATQTCIPVRKFVATKQPAVDTYVFTIQFTRGDGTMFTYGPFNGEAPSDENPPQYQFEYTVKNINGEWKVVTPPLYVP